MLPSLFLVLFAIAPGLIIAWFMYAKDKYNREPLRTLAISFVLGMISTVPAILFQLMARFLVGDASSSSPVVFYAFYAFVVVGGSEEITKFLAVRLYAYSKKEFDEPLDGIVYAVMVSMGFATLENFIYIKGHGVQVAFLRMFLSVPAHGAFGVLMGYYLGLAKFDIEKRSFYQRKGILLAIGFHGAFDFFLFLENDVLVTRFVSIGLLLLGAILTLLIAVRLGLHSIKLHLELSRRAHEKTNGFV